MSTEFGYVSLSERHYYSPRSYPDRYTVLYHAPGEKVLQNRTCATLPPEVAKRMAVLDVVSANDAVEGVGYWLSLAGARHYVLHLWAPIEDIFDLNPR